KFLESLSVVKIGVKDKTTFINMLTTSNTIQSFAEKVKYYGFTTFANNQQFQQYVNALNSIFNSLG
ncbi:MAG: hypothetical protein RMJ38_07690, partial [candidate division WOR-3 bacterium]|nr:hypothetical protein [candidate division WOR-3 bacterium]MDW8151301.1 hypothetical protein [candidate division WOR-3 bacterium]